MDDRRNPYLILGLDYGADSIAASKAFARATRRVRREENAPYSMEDVTWALHSIEHAESDPDATLDVYRVPADRSVYLASGLEDLLPATIPAERITQGKGLGRRLAKAQGIARLLQADLQQATVGALSDSLPKPAAPRSGRPSPRPNPHQPTTSTATDDNTGIAIGIGIVVLIILLFMVGAADESSSSEQSEANNPQPDPANVEIERDYTPPAPPPAADPVKWVDRGDCLISRGGEWGPGSCSRRDARVIAAKKDKSTGHSCPDETDLWFSDEWGVYCSIVVNDDTPEGGHWGIGPIHDGSCVRINSRGQLKAKSRCTRNAMPVLTTARTGEDCHTLMMRGDRAVYFGAEDGTNNYLCIDGYDWQVAGLRFP